jgi:hypothetical protein
MSRTLHPKKLPSEAMRGLALVVVLGIIAVECATIFIIFVPVVPETASEPCFGGGCPHYTSLLVFNYYGSISFHYFKVGMVYGACNSNGFQMVTSASRSPTFCGPFF